MIPREEDTWLERQRVRVWWLCMIPFAVLAFPLAKLCGIRGVSLSNAFAAIWDGIKTGRA